mgnify:FL=1
MFCIDTLHLLGLLWRQITLDLDEYVPIWYPKVRDIVMSLSSCIMVGDHILLILKSKIIAVKVKGNARFPSGSIYPSIISCPSRVWISATQSALYTLQFGVRILSALPGKVHILTFRALCAEYRVGAHHVTALGAWLLGMMRSTLAIGDNNAGGIFPLPEAVATNLRTGVFRITALGTCAFGTAAQLPRFQQAFTAQLGTQIDALLAAVRTKALNTVRFLIACSAQSSDNTLRFATTWACIFVLHNGMPLLGRV